jgi:hypothetical protein
VFPQSCVDPFHDDVVDLAVSPEGNFPKVLMDAPWQIDGRVNDFRSGPSSGQLQGLLSQGLPPYLNLDRHRQCAWRGENDCTSIPVDARRRAPRPIISVVEPPAINSRIVRIRAGASPCRSANGKAETDSRSARYGNMTTSRDESIRWLRPRSEELRRRLPLGWSLVWCLGAVVCAGTAYVSRMQSLGNLAREESAAPAAHEALSSGSQEAAGGPGRVPESTLSLGNSPETLMTDHVPAEPFSAGEADLVHTAPGNTETPAAGAPQIIEP